MPKRDSGGGSREALKGRWAHQEAPKRSRDYPGEPKERPKDQGRPKAVPKGCKGWVQGKPKGGPGKTQGYPTGIPERDQEKPKRLQGDPRGGSGGSG